MRSLRISTGDTIYIVKKDGLKPIDKIWFTEEEWKWAQKLGRSKRDPQEQKEFFMGLVERKKEDPNWCLFTNFPEGSGTSLASLQEVPSARTVAHDDNNTRKKLSNAELCHRLIVDIWGPNAGRKGNGESA